MRFGAKAAGKDMIDNVPRTLAKTAPADAIATVDARIEDVIFFSFQRRESRPSPRGSCHQGTCADQPSSLIMIRKEGDEVMISGVLARTGCCLKDLLFISRSES